MAVTVVRPEVSRTYLSVFLSPEVEQGPIRKLSSRRTRSCNNPEIEKFVLKAGFASEWLIILGVEAAAGRAKHGANKGARLDPHTYTMDGASAGGKTADR